MLSVRLPEGLRAWLVDYALMRGAPVSAIVVAALEEFRELTLSGVPDLPAADGRSAGLGRVRGAGARSSSSAGRASAVSRPAAGAPAEPRDYAAGSPLERVVAARQRGPVALARRDVRAGRVLVDGVVCRDPERLVAPASVEVT